MRRRAFIALTGAAAAFPRIAFAQQAAAGTKRLAFIFTLAPDDPQTPKFVQALRDGLAGQGWAEGRNLLIDTWWSVNTPAASLKAGQEAAALKPDVILPVAQVAFANTATAAAAGLVPITSIPITFALANEAAAIGLVGSFAHPIGNVTGFPNLDPTPRAGKLLEMLSELAPDIKRAGYMNDPSLATFAASYDAFAAAAKAKGIEPVAVGVSDPDQIAGTLANFAQPWSGLVVAGVFSVANRAEIVADIVRLRLPAVHALDLFATVGGLVVYDVDAPEVVRQAADYAGRILNGAKITDLPVQAPTKLTLVVNLKTAREQGFSIPLSLLARADEVIQ